VARLLRLDAAAAGHAVAIAASEASGLKENFGTMVKPLHAGLAARNGVHAGLLARGGMTASARALDGPQGFLQAMDGTHVATGDALADLGERWEIVETGITVKLYPSCAGTHPALDALLDLRRRERFAAADVEQISIDVDSITPTILIYERPASGLEGKFSMPFCAAAAVVFGRVGLETFDAPALSDEDVTAIMQRVTMRVDPTLDGIGPALTQARVSVRLRDGRTLTQYANGARGYPERPATVDELDAKFLQCARRALPEASCQRALETVRQIDQLADVRGLTATLSLAGERSGA
jgi:2-methylcitrate dehydratase PrpD